MKSKTFSGRSLRSSLKGSTWILVLLLLGFMVAFPVAELMLIGNQTDEIHQDDFCHDLFLSDSSRLFGYNACGRCKCPE